MLAALKMSIAPLQEQFEDNEQVSAALNNIAGIADQALLEIRTTSYLLHPPLLDEAGLAAAVRWYTEGFSQRSGIDVKVTFLPILNEYRNTLKSSFSTATGKPDKCPSPFPSFHRKHYAGEQY
jgi:signal transduction histidine kinase